MRESRLSLGLSVAALSLALAAEPLPPLRLGRPPAEPRPKSKHKRSFKGSKAAKKAQRRKS